MSSSSKQLNPFYIDKVTAGHNGDDDDWADSFDDNNNTEGWGDDEEDLEDLLEQEGQQPRRSKGGYLPVRNLTAAQKQQLDSDTRWRRNSYCCLLLVAAVVAAYLHAKNGTSFANKDDSKNSLPIQRITILGERNSGLEWLEERLKACYPNHVTVTSTLFRKGYFFQDKPSKEQQPKTIVVAVFLNPYDWVELMRLRPQFMPLHTNIPSWKPFLLSPWTMDRPPSDASFSSSPNKARVCQQNFTYHQVVSCSPPSKDDNGATDFHHPIYELRRSGSGEPYSNILKLRSDKIRNFLQEVARFDSVEKVVSVRYETLVEDTLDEKGEPTTIPGLWTALQEIANTSASLDPMCDLKGPGKKHFFAPAMGNHDTMTPEFVEFMNSQVDWKAENLVGYKQWDANKIPLSPTDYDAGSDETGPSHTNKDNDQTDDGAATDDATPAPSTAQDNTPGAPTIAPSGPVVTEKPVLEPTTPVPTTTPKTSIPTIFATKKPTIPVTRAPKKVVSTAPATNPTTTSTPVQTDATTTAPSTTTNSPTTEPKTGTPTIFATKKPTVPITRAPKKAASTAPAPDPTTTSTPGQPDAATAAPSTTTNSPTKEPKTGSPTSVVTKEPTVPVTRPKADPSIAPAGDPTTTTTPEPTDATTTAPSTTPITPSPTILSKQGDTVPPSVAPSAVTVPIDSAPSPADQDNKTAPGP